MIKKRYLIDQAMTEIGMGGYQFDASPEEHTDILRQMDAMVAMWSSKGVDIGYNEKLDKLFVIEVNSAPGMENSTLKDYTKAILNA